MTTGKRYYVSVNFICDTDGSEKNEEPTPDQLNEAFKAYRHKDIETQKHKQIHTQIH